ncbi:MAG: ATP-binding cassette domain-containing protein [Lentisphaerota bacterium]
MALIGLQNVRIAFGGPLLLDSVSLQIEKGERVCLLGRNGEGKSTLLRILAGELEPPTGVISRQKDLRVGYMPQQVPKEAPGTVADVVAEGLGKIKDEWERTRLIQKAMSQMGLDPKEIFNGLSGGQKRRALLARALVREPDLLILDEPTNHLDIASIQWLENFFLRWPGTLLFVTHDRVFLRKLSTRIVELDRGHLANWDCPYDKYLERKQAQLEAEEQQNAVFDKKLAQEETWLRKGVKARRTRNEGRVRDLMRLRAERNARREVGGSVNMQLQTAERSGMKVITAKNLSYTWGREPILSGFSAQIMRGDKIGLMGPNGCGKTTLLNLLLGRLAPQEGTVEHGTKLEVAYFDQHRAQLDEDQSVAYNIADGNETVLICGRTRRVISYLEDFLFAPDRSRTPVRALSGGERNRLLLARLFSKPSNVLMLDEPTNDLDVETLDLLEDLLVEYTGTLLLVSHDREFINEVVTSTLVFEGQGRVVEYVGGYDDWLKQRPLPEEPQPRKKETATEPPKPPPSRPRKLSFKERKELESLPQQIEALEKELEELHRQMSDPAYYRSPPETISANAERAKQIPEELDQAYARWAEIEEKSG